ncbi:MAG TPA: hypothetical protein VJT72_19605 [Pseudonocardiaceae bacterium]|nr:hypothetical protein [Pseudonocardiaceae bacterium]
MLRPDGRALIDESLTARPYARRITAATFSTVCLEPGQPHQRPTFGVGDWDTAQRVKQNGQPGGVPGRQGRLGHAVGPFRPQDGDGDVHLAPLGESGGGL